MRELPLSCVTALGFGVRALPVPLYLRGHGAALVGTRHGTPDLDLDAGTIPVLGVAFGDTWDSAVWQLVEDATHRRLSRARQNGLRPPDAVSVGAGPNARVAGIRALGAALARHLTATPVRAGTLITGWEASVPALRGVDGSLRCHLLHELAGFSLVGAVLRLRGTPGALYAVGCHPSPRQALVRAVHAVLGKFLTASLAPTGTAGGWATGGDGGGTADDGTDLGSIGAVAYAELPDGTGGTDGADGAPVSAFSSRLRAAGLRGYLRTVGPPERTAGPPGTATAVLCRLEPQAPVPDSVWRPWDVAALQLSAPVQAALPCPPERVRASRGYHENSKMRRAFGTLPLVDVAAMAPPARQLLGRAYRDFRYTPREYRVTGSAGVSPLPLAETVRRRRSWASFADTPLDLDRLGRVLTLSYGITGTAVTGGGVRLPLRATPSAGGLYSSDLFLLADRVDGVTPGLYYFHPGREALQLVRADCSLARAAEQTGYPARVAQAAALVIYVGALRRNQWKYWERGYRTVLLDCGHLAQSVVIAASALGLTAHPMIAFLDDYFNDLVGVDGIDDAVLYLTLLGPTVGTPVPAEEDPMTRHPDADQAAHRSPGGGGARTEGTRQA